MCFLITSIVLHYQIWIGCPQQLQSKGRRQHTLWCCKQDCCRHNHNGCHFVSN